MTEHKQHFLPQQHQRLSHRLDTLGIHTWALWVLTYVVIFGVTSLSTLQYRIPLLMSLTPLPRPASAPTQSMMHLSKNSSPCRALQKAYIPRRILSLIRWLGCGSHLCFIKQDCQAKTYILTVRKRPSRNLTAFSVQRSAFSRSTRLT